MLRHTLATAAVFLLFLQYSTVESAVAADLVTQLPGWKGPIPFKMYSGYFKLEHISSKYNYYMHYIFMESLRDPAKDPVVLWQQGGPGGSSINVGLFTEMGYFQLNDDCPRNATTGLPEPLVNPYSWNHISNMLYFDHPAGVDFSYCTDKKTEKPVACSWNDQTQAVELYETLVAFFAAFPEFNKHKVFFSGESYSGMYLPSLVYHYSQQKNPPFKLEGFAVGNGCIGIKGQSIKKPGNCNGPTSVKISVDVLFGHALYSKQTYDYVYKMCKFPVWNNMTNECKAAINLMSKEIGPYNPYNVYDNCGNNMDSHLEKKTFSEWMGEDFSGAAGLVGGGNSYACGTFATVSAYISNKEVQKALHCAGKQGLSKFNYTPFTFDPIDKYPELIKKYRTMIYNGDVDSVCPWNQNEQWTSSLGLKVKQRWTPWYTKPGDEIVAGALTQYEVPGATWPFSFITVRESGHMVPHYQPYRAFVMMQRFLENKL